MKNNINIRPIEKKDAPVLFEIIDKNRKRLIPYFPISTGKVHDISGALNYIQNKIDLAESKSSFCFLAEENDKAIGILFLKNIDWNVLKCEGAYFIDKNHEGRGIASSAVGLLTKYAFDILKLKKVFLRIDPKNNASKMVALKNGFRLEGLLQQEFITGEGKLIDVEYYGLLNKNN